MIQQFPCVVCHKSVGDKENLIFCDLCKLWVHSKCNNFNYVDYHYLSGCVDPWYCLNCNSEIYALGNLSKVLCHLQGKILLTPSNWII